MIRAALYCRLSDEDRNKKTAKDESESIRNQKSLLLAYCKEQNWEVIGIFCDEDMSGADRDRPEFNHMIAMCREGHVDVVLCKTQSRFSRDMEVVEHYIHNRFREWGVRFVGLMDHADTEDVANKKSRQINGLVNEWYLEDLSENIKRTLRHKKEKGIYTGSFAPYGYKLDQEVKGKLFVDEPAAMVVRRIYDCYLAGMGYIKIAKQLNREGVPCPSEYKKLCGSKFRTHTEKITSSVWTDATIRQILKNPVYIGTLIQAKTEKISYKKKTRRTVPEREQIIFKDSHEPVVEAEVWNQVNAMFQNRKRVQKDNGERHVFSGIVCCGVCGSSMWKMSYKLKHGRYSYLKCKASKCSESMCKNKESIRLDTLHRLVQKEMCFVLEEYYKPERISRKVVNQAGARSTTQIETIQEHILKQKINIKQLYKDKLNGIIDNEIFYMLSQELKEEIQSLEKRIKEMEQTATVIVEPESYIEEFPKRVTADAFTVSTMIEKIEVGAVSEGTREITIHWNL